MEKKITMHSKNRILEFFPDSIMIKMYTMLLQNNLKIVKLGCGMARFGNFFIII